MNMEDILKQLAGGEMPEGAVGVMMGGNGNDNLSGESALIMEITGTHQRCVSKMKAVMHESGITAKDMASDANTKMLAMGYLIGCIHIAERFGDRILPRNLATLLSTSGFVGNSDMLDVYYSVLEKAVAEYLDTTTISDIQDHDPEGAIGIALARRQKEEAIAKAARPARDERKKNGLPGKSKVN